VLQAAFAQEDAFVGADEAVVVLDGEDAVMHDPP